MLKHSLVLCLSLTSDRHCSGGKHSAVLNINSPLYCQTDTHMATELVERVENNEVKERSTFLLSIHASQVEITWPFMSICCISLNGKLISSEECWRYDHCNYIFLVSDNQRNFFFTGNRRKQFQLYQYFCQMRERVFIVQYLFLLQEHLGNQKCFLYVKEKLAVRLIWNKTALLYT